MRFFLLLFLAFSCLRAPQPLFASDIVSRAADGSRETQTRRSKVSPKYFADPDSNYSNVQLDRNRAILVQDDKGKPALYVICDRNERCLPLFRHSKREILTHWQPASVQGDVYTFKSIIGERKAGSQSRSPLN
jgi:hypothetical protein